MLFRHPAGVRLALTSGHVEIVGPEWQDLHEMFHREALAAGCECDQNTIRTTTLQAPTASDAAVTPLDEAAGIRAALIRMVERNDDDDFTAAGTPNLKVLAKETGFKVNKTQALAVWHVLEEEAKAGEGDPAANSGETDPDADE